jgi:hypothetical protein
MTAARHQASPLEEEVKEDMKNMNDRNDGRTGREGRTRRPLRRRAGALAAVLTGTALLAAACSGSPAQANTFAPGATYAQTLAFAKCMRANGVPNFPNPDRQGNFNNNNPEIQAMDGDGGSQQGAPHTVSPQRNVLFVCRSVLPNAGTGLTLEQMQQISQQNLRDAVQAAKCMRRHGITNFADPVASNPNQGGGGVSWQPVISAIQAGSLSTSTPSYEAAFMACNGGKVAGGYIPPEFAPGQSPVVFPSGSGSPPPVSGNGP